MKELSHGKDYGLDGEPQSSCSVLRDWVMSSTFPKVPPTEAYESRDGPLFDFCGHKAVKLSRFENKEISWHVRARRRKTLFWTSRYDHIVTDMFSSKIEVAISGRLSIYIYSKDDSKLLFIIRLRRGFRNLDAYMNNGGIFETFATLHVTFMPWVVTALCRIS
jgi:hypothetical protein